MAAKFNGFADYKQGQMSVHVGRRGRETPMFKVFLPINGAAILTEQQALDLCDALSDALDDWETDRVGV